MLKFIKGKHYQPTADRIKLQKELFAFDKSARHGFPHRPSAIAWDPKLRLLAIGTQTGTITIYGGPGVEIYGKHGGESASVTRLLFLPGEGRLISCLENNSIHLWEVNFKNGRSVLEEKKSCSLEGRMKKVTACCLRANGEELFIGTEGGNIFVLELNKFLISDNIIIYQDVVMQNVPDDYKVNPGAVETIAPHPTDENKILIGYNRGLLVLWDIQSASANKTYVGSQQLESVAWKRDGKKFTTSHNDGTYITWDINDTACDDKVISPYGPFPCKAITKIGYYTTKGDDFLIFSGGMPRASYGDRHTVSVLQGDVKHVTFNFTSRVVDYVVISDSDGESGYDDPHTLLVLAEEELVPIDLLSENWTVLRSPYLASLHSSSITCAWHANNVEKEVYQKIEVAGQQQLKGTYSSRDWPITGGENLTPKSDQLDVLITGHEDGTVRFWDCSTSTLRLLYTFSISKVFIGEDDGIEPAEEVEEWPPFRKIGCFDPYTDDPRLAIKKIAFCALTGTLVVSGTAGQHLVLRVNTEEVDKEIESVTMNIVSERDNFAWKGHEKLDVKKGSLVFPQGYQPDLIIQVLPPAACTALTLHSDWGIIAVGTGHGFGLIDIVQKKTIISKCTLNPNDVSGVGETTMTRRKSFKKSLRESFRRLRRSRSQRSPNAAPVAAADKKPSPARSKSSKAEESGGDAPLSPASSGSGVSPTGVTKSVERQIEARPKDDSSGSMVRCLYFAQTYIISQNSTSATCWAGTNNGTIFIYLISLPAPDKRKDTPMTVQLGKEIQLKHRAPVISIHVIDSSNVCLPEPLEVAFNRAKKPENAGGSHRVVICSEEQFKIFTLPTLKPFGKLKMTAHEGARVRKISFANFRSKENPAYVENCFVCLSNQGDLTVFSVPELRRQFHAECVRREDINGMLSLVLTSTGQGFYMHSSSEMQRFSLSAANVTAPLCKIEFPEGMRLPPTPEKIPITPESPANDDIQLNNSINKKDGRGDESILSDEERRADDSAADITIDSVRDHVNGEGDRVVTTVKDGVVTVTTEKVEEKTDVLREEVTVIQTTTFMATENVPVAVQD